MFGVSPAYFVSRHTDRFSFGAIADDLPRLAAMGFDAFQAEVFHPEAIDDWCRDGAAQIAEAARQAGMVVSQVVGHCLLHGFATPEALASEQGITEADRLLQGLQRLDGCDVLTVVLPPFQPRDAAQLTRRAWLGHRQRLAAKLHRLLDIAGQAGCRLALELVPGSLVGGVEGFLRLHAELGHDALGYNFDTGHAWTAREWVPSIPAALGPLILGTHLKDNRQDGAALAPGCGSVPWAETLAALRAAGYGGSLDIEFLCATDEAHAAYAGALSHLQAAVADGGGLPRSQPC